MSNDTERSNEQPNEHRTALEIAARAVVDAAWTEDSTLPRDVQDAIDNLERILEKPKTRGRPAVSQETIDKIKAETGTLKEIGWKYCLSSRTVSKYRRTTSKKCGE